MLKIAMIMADFSGAEAEELRRALSFHRSVERMEKVSVKLRAGMEKNGVAPEVILKIIQSISSIALYGFPESHAISFAILAYGSAYLKVHRAAEFYASLLNNQPMGFYAPATIVKDAHRHGIRMRPVCVTDSGRDRQATAVLIPGRFEEVRRPNERGVTHFGGARGVELFRATSARGDVGSGRAGAGGTLCCSRDR